MKKTFIILTSLLLICIIFLGCNTANSTINTSKELNKNLNILSNTVNKLDTVNNEYLVSNELYSLQNTNKATIPLKTEKTRLANSTNVSIIDEKNSELKELLKDEIISRLYCDSEGNCKLCNEPYICDSNGICSSCNKSIICDENGNCTYCKDTLVINDNNCENCNNSCVSNTLSNHQLSQNTKLNLQKISNLNKTSSVQNIDKVNYDDDININVVDNISNPEDTNTTENPNTDTQNQDKQNEPTIKYYYYSEERFNPDLLKYKPRFVNQINFSSANDNLKNYVEKLQKLYTMTADVVEANNTLASYKVIILDDITEAKELNECILNGKCVPSDNQMIALSNYIDDIKTTINNLKDCNGNLTSEINKIANRNTGINQSIDVTNSNYLRILNQIDTRISYHENALATLEQIKYLLQDAQNNKANTSIEDLNNQTNFNDNVIDDSTNTPDLNNAEILVDPDSNSIIVTSPEETVPEDDSLITNQDIEQNDNSTEHNQSNEIPPITPSDLDDMVLDAPILENNSSINNTTDNDEKVITNESTNTANTETTSVTEQTIIDETTSPIDDTDNESTDNTTEIPNDSNSENTEDNTKTITSEEDTATPSGNLDTYNENTYSNLQDNNSKPTETTPEDEGIETSPDNTDIVEANPNQNTNLLTDDLNETISNQNAPQMVDGAINSDIVLNNGGTNNLVSNSNTNSIISQNNINSNDIGNNSYRYDEHGNLYNNTNGYDNNSNHNINNKNNNVNTYEYNTLLDSINRGTINNGINNL